MWQQYSLSLKPKILLVVLIFALLTGFVKSYPYVLLNFNSLEVEIPLPNINSLNYNVYTRWSIGRTLLRHDNAKAALALLAPLRSYADTNQLLLIDILNAQVINKNFLEATDLYQQVRRDIYPTRLISDTAALAYIGLGKYSAAVELRPQDLYANYQLLKRANLISQEKFLDPLKHFSVDSLLSPNKYILENSFAIIPDLYANDIWSTDVLLVTVPHLLWRTYQLPQLEALLVNLEPKLSKEVISSWRQEVVLRRSDTVTRFSGELPCKPGQERLLEKTNLLESTKLNSSTISNTSQEAFWQWGASDGTNHNDALFVGGVDSLYSGSAIRIDGLWQKTDTNQIEVSYAEFASKNFYLDSLQDYTLSICYRTSIYGDPQAFIALLEYTPNPSYIFTHTTLPRTDSKWQRVEVSGKGPSKVVPLKLILRMSGTGTVWYDNVYLASRPITQ